MRVNFLKAALKTDLEEEEMNETHTPFTRQELEEILTKTSFKITQIYNKTPIHLRKGVSVQSNVKLPNRQMIVVARKYQE